MSDEKAAAVKAEDQRLLDAKVIRKVKFPTWLSNTVPVKKKNGKWRMCIDFTDLNKACPKDDFPLPRIDKIVDDAANSQLMSLLYCFLGYRQIWMRKEDEEKTSFTTPFGIYCYVLTLLSAPICIPQAHRSCSFSLRVFPQDLSIHETKDTRNNLLT